MADQRVLIEGDVKVKQDSKKWKYFWCILTKLSPVADCLHLQIYRDSKDRCKNGSTKSSLSLDGFLGMETGFTLEKESNTIAIICKEIVVLLAFDTRELLIQWQVKIRAHLSEEQHFLVQITNLPPKSKLSCGPARLHLQDHAFCLVSGIPPRLLGFWPLKELRRFGVIDGKFCFEGGSQCGKGEGLHILHTNQTEELANSFELASQGKLHRRRRLSSNKNSSIDGTVRMSLQQTKCHKSCECGSNESSRPLISSSSESSVCDACSEIIRFNGCNYDNEISSDEQYSSRSTCCTILRCSSNLSCSGVQPYISSASVAADNECFFTSSPSLAMLNNCTDNRHSMQGLSNIDSNTLPRTSNDNNRCSWASSHCSRCGHHYCSGSNGCSDDVSNKSLPNNTISAINLSDLRSISPTSIRECLRHHNHQMINANKSSSIIPDRASLCSQSSHSSGASNSSNSSGSHSSGRCNCSNEYSVPRTQHNQHNQHNSHIILDMLYDKPKNIQHKLCNIVNKSEHMALCSCHLDQIDVTNRNVAFGHKFISTGIIVNNLSENCKDLSIKECNGVKCQRIEDCNAQHYAVPRTALAHIYLKELKQNQNSIMDGLSQNHIGEQYDVPRKYRDTLNQSTNQSLCSCATSAMIRKRNISTSFECNNTNSEAFFDTNRVPNNSTLLTNNTYPTHVKAINQLTVSSCQNFDSSHQSSDWIQPQLVNPLGIQRLTISQQQSEYRTDKHFSANSALTPETIEVNNVNGNKTSIIADVEQQQSKSTQCNAKVDFVNIDLVNKEQNMLTHSSSDSTSPKCPNYVNMHFVQSIAFYENIMCKNGSIEYNNQMMDRIVKDPMPSPLQNDKNREHYELMSFKDKNPKRKSINSIESMSSDDYMLMEPIVLNKTSHLNDENSQKSKENIVIKPTNHHLKKTESRITEYHGISKSPYKSHSFQSGPVNEFKRKQSLRQRSNSIDGRNRNYKFSISDTTPSSCPSSPSLNSKSCIENRRFFILSKLSYKSKEKSFSIDDISPAQLSVSHNNHYFKFGHSLPFHKSADCLRQRADDYRSSEEDLCTSSQITVLCASPVKTSCARPTNKTESSENSDVVVEDVVVVDDDVVDDTSAEIIKGNKTESKSHRNLNDNLNFVDSTSLSDMSDYIETLSLCSRTSSGSDPTYVRSSDLTAKSLPINSISLFKPISKAEYSAERKVIDCSTQLHKGLTELLHSPSPGYESETSTPII